jgi:hypothetical protein
MKVSISPRLALLIIASMFLFPLLLAWMMYSGSLEFKPGSTRNRGTLVDPPVSLDWAVSSLLPHESDDMSEPNQSIDVFEKHWVILKSIPAACDDLCLRKVSDLRQIHLASGHQQTRIRLALLLEESRPATQEQTLLEIYPKFHLLEDSSNQLSEMLRGIQGNLSIQPELSGSIFMIDPLGNIMMYYQANSDPNDVKKDLKRLLN